MLSPCDPQPCGFCSHVRVGVQTKTRLHAHACDLPASPPTTARPSACRLPRGELDVTHVGPVLRVWGSRRWAGMVVFAPFSPCDQLRAGAAAPGVLQRWDRGRAGGTAPSHSNSIPAAVLARRETPGCLCLLAVLSPLPRQLRIPSAVGRIGSAAGQHCSSACKPGSWGHCREIAPFAGPCITKPGPDPDLTLGRRGEERAQRGWARGEEPKEGCEPQLSAHQSNQ